MSDRMRWGIGAAVGGASYVLGYLVSRAPAGEVAGAAIAIIGLAVLSWLVPVTIGRAQHTRPRLEGTRAQTLDDAGGRACPLRHRRPLPVESVPPAVAPRAPLGAARGQHVYAARA